MARWYEHVRLEDPEAGPADAGRLIGDVSHAAGNLVHRMYYWTAVLEEQPAEQSGEEAVRELRDTLSGLHRLVKKTMDLLRPIKLRLITVAGRDLVRSMALRLGAVPGEDELEKFASDLETEILVDPVQLDRALGLVADAFAREAGGRHEIWLGKVGDGVPAVRIESSLDASVGGETSEPTRVDKEVGLALARKIFLALGWQADVLDCGKNKSLSVVVPLVAPARKASVETTLNEERRPAD